VPREAQRQTNEREAWWSNWRQAISTQDYKEFVGGSKNFGQFLIFY
jgi:hypothetical protein